MMVGKWWLTWAVNSLSRWPELCFLSCNVVKYLVLSFTYLLRNFSFLRRDITKVWLFLTPQPEGFKNGESDSFWQEDGRKSFHLQGFLFIVMIHLLSSLFFKSRWEWVWRANIRENFLFLKKFIFFHEYCLWNCELEDWKAEDSRCIRQDHTTNFSFLAAMAMFRAMFDFLPCLEIW